MFHIREDPGQGTGFMADCDPDVHLQLQEWTGARLPEAAMTSVCMLPELRPVFPQVNVFRFQNEKHLSEAWEVGSLCASAMHSGTALGVFLRKCFHRAPPVTALSLAEQK